MGDDIDRTSRRLVINPQEAEIVRGIFSIYLEEESLLETLRQVNARRWERKRWLTRNNQMRGGGPWDKSNLYNLLTNIAYTGRVTYCGETYPGEHEAIIDVATWEEVQAVMKRNGKSGPRRSSTDAALRGILYCAHCNVPMIHTFSVKNGTRRYRYYTCMTAKKRGREACPSRSLPAGEIENFVIERIRTIGTDPCLLEETMSRIHQIAQAEVRRVQKRAREANATIRALQAKVLQSTENSSALEALSERLRGAEEELKSARVALNQAERIIPSEADIREALASFAPLWEAMTTAERARILSLILERASYDSAGGTLAITFRPGGFRALSPAAANVEVSHES